MGDLHPADIRYSYTISRHNVKSDFDWNNKVGPWSECNRVCQGKHRGCGTRGEPECETWQQSTSTTLSSIVIGVK